MTTLGGEVNGIKAPVPGMPVFTVGETSLLFLDRQGGVIGGYQGKLSIANGLVLELGQSLLLTETTVAKALGQEQKPVKSSVRSESLKAERTTFELPAPANRSASQVPALALTGTVFSDGFKSGLGSWTIQGSPTWGVTSYRATAGTKSAYCIGSAFSCARHLPQLHRRLHLRRSFQPGQQQYGHPGVRFVAGQQVGI